MNSHNSSHNLADNMSLHKLVKKTLSGRHEFTQTYHILSGSTWIHTITRQKWSHTKLTTLSGSTCTNLLTTLQDRDINSHNSPHYKKVMNSHNSPHYKTVMNSHNSPHYHAQMNSHKLTTLSVSTCINSHNSSQDRDINSQYSSHYKTKSHKFTQLTTLQDRDMNSHNSPHY